MNGLSFWVGVGILSFLFAWRWSSRKLHIPFPASMGWMLHGIEPLIPADKILRGAGVEAGMFILDVGPGIGRVALPAAMLVGSTGRVVAADIQHDMLVTVRRRAEAAGVAEWVETKLLCADQDEFGDNLYDRVLMIDMLGEIPDRNAALRSAHRALRPDGKLIVAEVYGDPHYQRWTVVRELASQAGFSATKTACLGGYYAVCAKVSNS